MEITEPVNENINEKLQDVPPKPVSTRLQAVENLEKQDKVEKKPKRRESVSKCVFLIQLPFYYKFLVGNTQNGNLSTPLIFKII